MNNDLSSPRTPYSRPEAEAVRLRSRPKKKSVSPKDMDVWRLRSRKRRKKTTANQTARLYEHYSRTVSCCLKSPKKVAAAARRARIAERREILRYEKSASANYGIKYWVTAKKITPADSNEASK